MKCVAAGPRFLKCYDSSTTDIASSVVAAGPRFLKCYDSRRGGDVEQGVAAGPRSEEHTSELQSLMRISYAVFCLKKKKTTKKITSINITEVIRSRHK